MTPLGHASISIITKKFFKQLNLKYLVTGGIIPDIDFILLWHNEFNSIHRVISHNIFFMLFLILFIWLIEKNKIVISLSFLIGFMLHLLIDSILDTNPSNGIGVAILYPVSDFMFSPINLGHAFKANTTWAEISNHIKGSLLVTVIEIPFWIYSLIIINREHRAKTNTKSPI